MTPSSQKQRPKCLKKSKNIQIELFDKGMVRVEYCPHMCITCCLYACCYFVATERPLAQNTDSQHK